MTVSIARPKLEGNIAVGDDRQIGFAEFGAPQGRAIFWLHGTPGARRQIPIEARVYAEENDIRLIGVDRPGIGSSTPHQYENVFAFADDLRTMADTLGIDKMAVIGLSGGGPYSLACAAAMPDRVVAPVCSVASPRPRARSRRRRRDGPRFARRTAARGGRLPDQICGERLDPADTAGRVPALEVTASPTRPETDRSDHRLCMSVRRRPSATPRCPATVRHITSISTRRGRPASTSCSPTAWAPWRCVPIRSWASSASPTLARSAGWRCGLPRRRDWGCASTVAAYGIDEGSFVFEVACGDAAVITHGRLELKVVTRARHRRVRAPAGALLSGCPTTALLSRTERLRVGHMVLCNQFRHPAVLAKMATTLDQVSAGRLDLGIGSGSIEDEHNRLGLDWGTFAERSERLAETLKILTRAFANEVIDFAGVHYTVRDMPIVPGPVQGRGLPSPWEGREKYTLPLVARFADVWNVPTYARSASSSARCRCCGPSARTSAAIPSRSCCRSKPSWPWPPITRNYRRSARSPSDDSVDPGSGCTTAASSAPRRRSSSG